MIRRGWGAQVVSGIGFLGAGSIIISGKTKIKGADNGSSAPGLTACDWAEYWDWISLRPGSLPPGRVAHHDTTEELEYHLIFDDVWLSVYVELDDAVKMTDLVREFSPAGLVIGEVQIERKKRKGFRGGDQLKEYGT